jgi:uncharacterized OsmC-like protein
MAITTDVWRDGGWWHSATIQAGASDSAASAHEQLLSAMGSCLTVGYVLNATKRGVKIHDLEITPRAGNPVLNLPP